MTARAHQSRTRDVVLRAISERGPISASTIAADLGLTDTAVRRHLDHLTGEDLISTHEVGPARARRGRGRPARRYVLTEAGQQRLSGVYDDLAAQSLRFIAGREGRGAVREFAQARFEAQEQRYAVRLAEVGADRAGRVDALVDELTRDGYAASARPVGAPGHDTQLAGIQLCQGHCPFHHVAREFPEFCDAETSALSRLLGVHVQRLATLAQGAHVCTTFIPAGRDHSQRSTNERSAL